MTPVPAWAQAPDPSQVPVLPHGALVEVGHRPCGSGIPPETFAQVPGLPATLQDSHVPQLGAPQQTPSTQLPEAHWLPAVQAVPRAFSVQLLVLPLPWQVLGARQSASEVQGEVLQALVPHT